MLYQNQTLLYFSLHARSQKNLMSQIEEVRLTDVSLGIAFEI